MGWRRPQCRRFLSWWADPGNPLHNPNAPYLQTTNNTEEKQYLPEYLHIVLVSVILVVYFFLCSDALTFGVKSFSIKHCCFFISCLCCFLTFFLSNSQFSRSSNIRRHRENIAERKKLLINSQAVGWVFWVLEETLSLMLQFVIPQMLITCAVCLSNYPSVFLCWRKTFCHRFCFQMLLFV